MTSKARGGMARACAAAAIALCAGLLTTLLLVPASAEAEFRVGFQDYDYVSPDAQLRQKVFEKSAELNASIARLNLDWSQVAKTVPADPSNPADPAYDFSAIDAAVVEARANGLEPLIMIYRAPTFAEGPDRPFFAVPGTWKPQPAALGAFARAVAARYSGQFAGLPRVRLFQVWNEPNLNAWLNPQRDGDQLVSPSVFRDMVNAFYDAVKSVDPSNVVVTAGTAPYGEDTGDERVRPLDFLRALFCLKPNLRGTTCDQPTRFDVLAHQPINFFQGPTDGATDPDDATTADFKRVRRVLRAAEKAGTAKGGRHELWATEIWWESNPPDTEVGIPLQRQARYIEQAFYVLWKQGAEVVLNFQVHDAAVDPETPLSQVQTGVLFRDFRPKPSATAFSFPFVTDRRRNGKAPAWGIAPSSGKLRIQLKNGERWTTIERIRVRRGNVFTAKLRVERSAKLRASVGSERSLVWKQRFADAPPEPEAVRGGPRLLRPAGG